MAEQDNNSHDNAIGYALLAGFVAAIIYFVWTQLDTELRDIVRWIRYGEMWIIYGFLELISLTGLYDGGYTVDFNGKSVPWSQGFKDTPRFKAEDLTYSHLSYFTALSMTPLKYPMMVLCGLAALWAYRKGPKTLYRNKLDLEGLIRRQAVNFPVIAPFIKFNPSKQPPRPPGSPVPAELPPFAEALGPEEWLAYYDIPVPDGNIDISATEKAFTRQLGGRWKGALHLEPYKQVLLAAFCLKAARKRDDADAMLGRLALCWDTKKGLLLSRDRSLHKDALKILRNKKLSGETLTKVGRHAFETTALIRGLMTAREEGGVLAPAQFVWLRAHNRELWYPLNNLGRQSLHTEAIGAMSHYKAEKMTNRPIPIPKVGDAVDSIKDYMKTQQARPVPQLDYSGSKKRGVKKAV